MQIDYILCDEIPQDTLEGVGIMEGLEGKSDYRPALGKFHLLAHKPVKTRRKKVQVGWKPQLDHKGHPSQYHHALDAALVMPDGDLTARLVESTTTSASPCTHLRKEHNEEVKTLFAQRR